RLALDDLVAIVGGGERDQLDEIPSGGLQVVDEQRGPREGVRGGRVAGVVGALRSLGASPGGLAAHIVSEGLRGPERGRLLHRGASFSRPYRSRSSPRGGSLRKDTRPLNVDGVEGRYH